MCGITGIFAFNQIGRFNMINLAKATESLHSRGPDNQGLFNNEFVGLGHRRLSIIDTSALANQPMEDETGRFKIIYNGEVYNHRQLKKQLQSQGVEFKSTSDTEVVLQLYIRHKEKCLTMLNGFFAFAIYDMLEHSLFIARDRFGIKPLYYSHDEDKLLFASELKSLFKYGLKKEMDYTAVFTYFQLTYIPAPMTAMKGVKKLLPGHYLEINNEGIKATQYYAVVSEGKQSVITFDDAVIRLQELMDDSVQQRLIADVPLGTFLSGGIDSSVVSAIAARHVDHLNTFSVGYKDEPYFDETKFANAVAKHLGTEHTVFSLTNDDLYQHVFDLLDYSDEPFADSSAIAVNILSRKVRKHVTVALSGDGADELFAGYNKHAAMLRLMEGGFSSGLVRAFNPLWKMLPKSRHNVLANKIRQLDRYSGLSGLNPKDRYWALASWADEHYASQLMTPVLEKVEKEKFNNFKHQITRNIDQEAPSITQMLLADLSLVLPDDMLTKVDRYSMANSLEVRVPFLDHRVVEYAFSLPDDMKITNSLRKRVLQEAYKSWLPSSLYGRSKKGFEVPLHKWFRNELKSLITNDLLAEDFVREQGIFSYEVIHKLKKQLFSRSGADVTTKIWSLVVFQWWWKKYIDD